uniref:DUF2125 domain-containing protein n=1 Tax=Jiella pelagia TaxID=2986949 RepID=UPI0038B3772D
MSSSPAGKSRCAPCCSKWTPPTPSLSGDFSFDDEGRVSGTFQLAIADPNKIAELVTAVAPNLRDIASAIASALPMAGRRSDGRTVIELKARNGVLAVGIFPIGKLPALR